MRVPWTVVREHCEQDVKHYEQLVPQLEEREVVYTDWLNRLQDIQRARTQQKWKAQCGDGKTGPDYASINALGTKLAHFLFRVQQLLAENDTNRLIVFSQFDSTIERIKRVFETNGIEYVVCKG
jgi:hypothetical protein